MRELLARRRTPRAPSGRVEAVTWRACHHGRMPGTSSPPSPPRSSGTDENPTVAKRDSSVRRARRPVDFVPKLAIDVLRDGGREAYSYVHQGEACRIGTHSS